MAASLRLEPQMGKLLTVTVMYLAAQAASANPYLFYSSDPTKVLATCFAWYVTQGMRE
jgi:hypothetical protein